MAANDSFHYSAPFEAQFDGGRAQEYVIQALLRQMHTIDLVRVTAVHPTAGKVGFVDVVPLVQEAATNGQVIDQSPIYNVPYMQYQGGNSAVILAPVVGDIGLCAFAARDITNVKQTLKTGPANTQRAFSSADGLYIGGVLNADPTQYVKFSNAGIDIVSPSGHINLTTAGNVTVQAALCTFDCPVVFAQTVQGTQTGGGTITFAAPVTAPDFIAPNAALNTHQHAVSGGSTTGNPHN